MDEGKDIKQDTDADSDIEPHINLWRLLQRYSIFIDCEESRSRRNTLASKVILRRIFCPAFRIALVNSESYTITREHWQAFCNDPQGTADRYVQQVFANSNRYENQYRLFDQ